MKRMAFSILLFAIILGITIRSHVLEFVPYQLTDNDISDVYPSVWPTGPGRGRC